MYGSATWAFGELYGMAPDVAWASLVARRISLRKAGPAWEALRCGDGLGCESPRKRKAAKGHQDEPPETPKTPDLSCPNDVKCSTGR